jgi:hypothetical protein
MGKNVFPEHIGLRKLLPFKIRIKLKEMLTSVARWKGFGSVGRKIVSSLLGLLKESYHAKR